MLEMEKYQQEAREKWGHTAAYKEHAEKTKGYSKEKWHDLAADMDGIMAQFAKCMQTGAGPEDAAAQELVKTLRSHITAHYYHCTDAILYGLGQMYVGDARFKSNIDRHGDGTAAFICEAVKVYCRK